MATVKVKLRPSTVPGKAGTIYYQLTHLRQVKQITTKIHLHPKNWDSNNTQIIFTDSTSYLLQCKIDRDLDRLKKIICKMDTECANYTVNVIIEKFHQTNSDYTITDFFTKQIQKLKNDNRRGTARNYNKTLKSLKAFMKNTDSTFNIVTEQFVESYNTFLIQRGVVRNTISFYMRIFRSVYNKAVTQKIVEQTFPFKNVYTGVDKTRKRAVTETVISQLLSIDLKKSKALQFARDLFIFSFYTRGMAFVDIVFLKKSNIQNGYITYVRHKTGQELTIKIETKLQNIINRYEKKDSPYVFPILNTEDGNKAYSQYEIALNYYNRQLKRLSNFLEPNINLSSYTPRHTWATTARNKNVPLSIISAGMGHSSERTTLIYLTKIENSVIDEVNKTIIDSIKQ
ncbi:phage integrase SAM-like domain-containing protein [Phocaeicola vulgatus]|uniref:phage integrase SAM-like domain-containing protein n=1 Tax=Phocaeicola vulgatus TaxID=821 RepID=UPI0034A1E9B6